MTFQHHPFWDTKVPETLAEINDEHSTVRWVVLAGNEYDQLFEYLMDALHLYPKGRRRLRFAVCDPSNPVNHPFLEKHMVSITPSILLIHKGNCDTMISGAIDQARLNQVIDELCTERAEDRLADALAEIETVNVDEIVTMEYVQVGVDEEGRPLFRQQKKTTHRAGETPSL